MEPFKKNATLTMMAFRIMTLETVMLGVIYVEWHYATMLNVAMLNVVAP